MKRRNGGEIFGKVLYLFRDATQDFQRTPFFSAAERLFSNRLLPATQIRIFLPLAKKFL
jgi:hypothetical protein